MPELLLHLTQVDVYGAWAYVHIALGLAVYVAVMSTEVYFFCGLGRMDWWAGTRQGGFPMWTLASVGLFGLSLLDLTLWWGLL